MAKAVFKAVVSHDFRSVTAPLSGATFVAFRNPDGVNSDGVVWERGDNSWRCVAWDGDDYAPGDVDVDDMELELVDAAADGVTNFYFGSGCSREEFFTYLFGHEPESDGAYGPYYPAHMEAPASMFAKDNWHYYAFTLNPERVEEQEAELRGALERLDESVHEEMYGSSYRV